MVKSSLYRGTESIQEREGGDWVGGYSGEDRHRVVCGADGVQLGCEEGVVGRWCKVRSVERDREWQTGETDPCNTKENRNHTTYSK